MTENIARLRRRIVEMAHKAKEGHVPSCLSVLDIIYVLYNDVMGPDDKFVLSKGHASATLYVVLADRGIIPNAWLDDFCVRGAKLQGHPERGIPGVEFSTGSLGHGICGAVGMAYAKKIKREPGQIFCLIGDGECHEGSVFEAFRLADDLKLDNLTVIVDLNEPERRKHAERLACFVDDADEFDSELIRVPGHVHSALYHALSARPRLIFADTVKGKGIPEMEADPRAWHHRSLGLETMLEPA